MRQNAIQAVDDEKECRELEGIKDHQRAAEAVRPLA
jgi:hypothetical protein